MELFNISTVFSGFEYPYQLKKVADLNLVDFDYWFIMDAKLAEAYTHGMRDRFPARHLAPFAKRCDCDDVACLEMEKPRKVEIIHDFCTPGWEQRGEYDSFWDWFMEAIEEMISETDIAENELPEVEEETIE
ncbi:MAG: hypothetical protein HUJ67_03780 [Ruminiclostridium sp.]|nr:hypothetical protein [Ruminiclostridium sp.]